MKIVWIITIGLISLQSFAGDDKKVNASLSDVRIYTQGAMLMQKTNYSVGSGMNRIIIEGISPKIDVNTLQLNATGNVILLDTKYELYYPKPENLDITNGFPKHILRDISMLTDSIAQINYELQDLNNQIAVTTSAKAILNNNGAIKGQGKVNDSIPMLKDAIDYYFKKMNELNAIQMKLDKQKTIKTKELTRMQTRLKQLNDYGSNNGLIDPKDYSPVPRIIVTLQSSEAASGKIQLSYLVHEAGWSPQYDLRSSSLSSSVNLTYKAMVHQNSGLDWNNVKISLSTNNPNQNRVKPNLHPWYIDYLALRVQEKSGYGNAPAALYDKKAESQSARIIDQDEIESRSSIDFMQIVEHMISAEFKIDLNYSIASNNQAHMILVDNKELPTNFKYYTAPKLDQSVYLMAELTNLEELQLLPAKANVFFDGSYMGETYLDPTTMEDTLRLSLGVDPNVIVKRKLDKKSYKEKFIGTQRLATYFYEVEIKNQKAKAVDLVIEDQIPITTNTEIIIELLENGKGSLNEDTGILKWDLTLKAKESKTLRFGYSVKSDKQKNLLLSVY